MRSSHHLPTPLPPLFHILYYIHLRRAHFDEISTKFRRAVFDFEVCRSPTKFRTSKYFELRTYTLLGASPSPTRLAFFQKRTWAAAATKPSRRCGLRLGRLPRPRTRGYISFLSKGVCGDMMQRR